MILRPILAIFLFLAGNLLSGELRLKERIQKAHPGDFVVTETQRMITLLAIHTLSPNTLILEEISAPLANLKKIPESWQQWVKDRAPGHTSWSMIEIDLENGQLLECYSFSRGCWIELSQQENLLTTLLDLPLQKAPSSKQKKIGPPPLSGEPDHRKVWTPPLIFEGEKIENAPFEVYEALWPKDQSELSEREVLLYFDQLKQLPLPLWIQAETSHVTASLRTIDSGKHLSSLHRTIPRRVPEFISSPEKTKAGIKFTFKSPKYYKSFELYAVDVTKTEKQIVPIAHWRLVQEEECSRIEIDREELQQTLEKDHRYTWLLVPAGHRDLYAEMTKPFVWTPEKFFTK